MAPGVKSTPVAPRTLNVSGSPSASVPRSVTRVEPVSGGRLITSPIATGRRFGFEPSAKSSVAFWLGWIVTDFVAFSNNAGFGGATSTFHVFALVSPAIGTPANE